MEIDYPLRAQSWNAFETKAKLRRIEGKRGRAEGRRRRARFVSAGRGSAPSTRIARFALHDGSTVSEYAAVVKTKLILRSSTRRSVTPTPTLKKNSFFRKPDQVSRQLVNRKSARLAATTSVCGLLS
ncbi:hypothetical protein EVAR_29604_1 [Eumeta japonica]|uniref:Uncharacterized protein n=1 Tax=Eumeta variegata TaxID=151549 RepID=A0A4C1VWX8_EUMVA|nr:hypothetical protein EVAR_29604_1 [Eumeta japonica]